MTVNHYNLHFMQWPGSNDKFTHSYLYYFNEMNWTSLAERTNSVTSKNELSGFHIVIFWSSLNEYFMRCLHTVIYKVDLAFIINELPIKTKITTYQQIIANSSRGTPGECTEGLLAARCGLPAEAWVRGGEGRRWTAWRARARAEAR
jgi:hypothetical protein